MNLDDIQEYVQGLIAAHPQFVAKGLKPDNTEAQHAAREAAQSVPADTRGIVIDDGNYPKIAGREDALNKIGLCIIVWNLGSYGGESDKTGLLNDTIHIPVVIQENVKFNRGPEGTGIKTLKAVEYVIQAVSGNPKKTPPGTPIMSYTGEPWMSFGTSGGVRTAVVNFIKQNRITPI